MKTWILPLLMGLVLGASLTGFAWSFDELDDQRIRISTPDVQAEPTEVVLWTVDVDGESAR